MKREPEQINNIYKRIENDIDPPPNLIKSFTDKDWKHFDARKEKSRSEYEENVKQLYALLPTLEPSTIAEAYVQGCRLLQRNLSGYMAQHFEPVYFSIMVTAIEDRHLHTARMFLQVLADNAYEDIESVVAESIKVIPLQETALSVIHQLRLRTFQDEVDAIAKSTDNAHSNFARNIRQDLFEE